MKTAILSILLTATTLPASAELIITYAENPESNLSTLKNTNVFTFDDLKTGVDKNVSWSGVGSFDQLYVKNADIYGGAASAANPNGTKYSLQGAGTGVLSSTLTLNKDSSYFGMWWSAGDSSNVLKFYENSTLVGTFTTSSLMNLLPSSYDGNPKDRSQDRNEPFAFINFFGDANTAWNKVVLTNNNSSGFESDNYTSRTTAWNPLVDGALPGIPVAIVNGTTTTKVTKDTLAGTKWSLGQTAVAAAPGAPAPPVTLLAAFAGVIGLRQVRARRKQAA
ncbi:Npun_F0296 family exosortase-dependent surface protein [Prosthecobacter vanneervenii]|uniref:PEP-CTERM sorting domain-containing protein n=1 Tax=Prosthecobacter vanneervenii TaxID=48466 RepID=A0A7W7Y6W4_9BACT|nr:hypothetical protein [Prosthecobacter vanneervenii]MBB5030712.1 hypothetical protein [Prosthecobacter vanneervenii]